jgi:hypothetical protein
MGLEQSGEPLLVERSLHPPRFSLNRGPELASLRQLLPGSEPTRLKQRLEQCLKPLSARDCDAGLPVLD